MIHVFTRHSLIPKDTQAAQLFIIFTPPEASIESINGILARLCNTFPNAAVVLAGIQKETDHSSKKALPNFLEKYFSQETLNQAEQEALVDTLCPLVQTFVQACQAKLTLESKATALVGIGYTGSLVLELITRYPGIASRAITFGATLIHYPPTISLETTTHLFYAAADPMLPLSKALADREHFAFIQADHTQDTHATSDNCCDPELLDKMIERLQTCIPLRYIKEVQG